MITPEQRDWKDRPFGFLEEGIDGFEDERLDYIYELHQKMWELVRKIRPGSSGSLKDNVTVALLTSTEPEDENKHSFWEKVVGNDDWDKETGEYHGLER